MSIWRGSTLYIMYFVGECYSWASFFVGSGRGARFCLKGRTAFWGGGESRRLPRSAKPSAERRAGVRMAAFIVVGDIAGIEKAAAVADEGETSRFAEQSGGEVPSGDERLG